jgi:hypothetical protein
MHDFARCRKIAVSADAKGLVSQAGALLLMQTLQVTGLDRGLSQALERWRAPRAVHEPGRIIAGLAAPCWRIIADQPGKEPGGRSRAVAAPPRG